ncbi:glycosyltransferase [Amycolatopsis echigonensis]|uniref:Glycosyltransferase n=1 Tax=Amycolatopsis echigonensis TaxID=2576905 RepID=A0A8E1W6U5_9PSEU|nr:glycosyltransferase [Amycolatopsis echigonensis]MBB2504906.1 glycosyltransferase [Amycolatopsis echigonensis]
MIALAVALAVAAACLFAAAVRLQHGSVRSAPDGERGLTVAVVRSRGWLLGSGLAAAGSALHLTALSLAPVAIVQPIGVLSLVLTVLVRNPGVTRRAVVAMLLVCCGVGGFVLLSAAVPAASALPGFASAQPPVAVAGLLAVAACAVRGRSRCLAQATATAVLFGLGSATMRAGILHLVTGSAGSGLGLAAEAGTLLLAGGFLLHRAYASGSAATVVAVTTLLDPVTAVLTSAAFFGERPALSPAAAIAQAGLALAAVAGVLVLASEKPGRPVLKEHPMPTPRRGLRILLGADTFPPDVNGAAHFAERLARGLAARGHDVHVLTPEPFRAPGTDAQYARHHVRSFRTPFHPTFRFSTPRGARREADRLLDDLRPDVVHVQSHFAVGRALLSAASERAVPTIATNHFMPENLLGFVPLPAGATAALSRWAWKDFVRVFRQADIVTTPTRRAAQLLEESGFPGSVDVVSCGIDIAHYEPRPGEDRTDVGIQVLFVGRLDAEKNVDDLIRALPHVPSARANIVGDGSCRTHLAALARELGVADRVTFHGTVSDASLVHAYRTNDVFCMPGTAELQSLATMEAMAAGLPVLAADAMALPHLVRPGRNGYLYPPGAVDALGLLLAELAGNATARTEMGRASQEIVAEHGLDRTLETYETLYTAAVSARTQRPERKVQVLRAG